MRLRDALGLVYTEEQFADLFPANGQPAESPAALAWVLVLQFMKGLTARQAAEAVRSRIDWKYALGLELTDPGFDFSILCEFRARLIAGQAELHLITHVETDLATRQDVAAPDPIHAALAEKGHLMDAGYVYADLLVEAKRAYGIEIIGPLTKDVSWQAREKTGYGGASTSGPRSTLPSRL